LCTYRVAPRSQSPAKGTLCVGGRHRRPSTSVMARAEWGRRTNQGFVPSKFWLSCRRCKAAYLETLAPFARAARKGNSVTEWSPPFRSKGISQIEQSIAVLPKTLVQLWRNSLEIYVKVHVVMYFFFCRNITRVGGDCCKAACPLLFYQNVNL